MAKIAAIAAARIFISCLLFHNAQLFVDFVFESSFLAGNKATITLGVDPRLRWAISVEMV
jgi:hypothetical protein